MSGPITPFVYEDELVSALLISARHEDEVLAVSESGQCALPDEGSICIAGAPSGEWITLRNTEGNPQDGERCLLILNTFVRDQKMSAVSESGWSVQVFSGRKPLVVDACREPLQSPSASAARKASGEGEWITLEDSDGNPRGGVLRSVTFVSEPGWSAQVFSGRKPRNGERYLLILNTFGGDGRGRKSVSTHLAREIFGGVSL